MTMMGINWLTYQEAQRSNVAREGETVRHNVATENLGSLQFGETVRTNRANEGIKVATLDETRRSNFVNEGLKFDTLKESIRTNMVNESIREGTLNETVRSNRAKEDISLKTLAETVRSNQTKEVENIRSNMAREVELNRSNTAKENIDIYKTDIKLLSDVAPISALIETKTMKNYNPWSVGSEAFGNTILNLLPSIKIGSSGNQKIGGNLFQTHSGYKPIR